MGANDAAEMLEVAKAECARLERELADMQALAQVNAMNYSDHAAAIQDAKDARAALAAVQQPNRDALAEVAYRAWCHARRGNPMDDREYEAIRSRVEFEWMHEVADAVLAALAVPATGEARKPEAAPSDEGNEIDRDAENEACRFLRERKAAPYDTDLDVLTLIVRDVVNDGKAGELHLSGPEARRIAERAFAAGFSRSQPVQAPSDTDRQALTDEALWDFAHDLLDVWNVEDLNPPSLVEQFRDQFVARFGTSQPVQVEPTVEEWTAEVLAERARHPLMVLDASQPVQVEVTDWKREFVEMRDTANKNADRAHALDLELGKTKRELAALRAALSAALGGGDQ